MLFWTPHFSVLDSTFFVLDSEFWLDSTFKIDPGALWRSVLSARVPACRKLKMVGQTSMAQNALVDSLMPHSEKYGNERVKNSCCDVRTLLSTLCAPYEATRSTAQTARWTWRSVLHVDNRPTSEGNTFRHKALQNQQHTHWHLTFTTRYTTYNFLTCARKRR